MIVFGDSLSDVGNISSATFSSTPGSYYWNGRFSNGPVYAEALATGLGLPALTRSTSNGNDFAYGGAQTTGTGGLEGLFIRDLDEQVTQYLGSRTPTATTLYVVFAGANDLIDSQTNPTVPVNKIGSEIGRLITAGARQFLVFNLPPLGFTPRYNGSTATRDSYNARSAQFNTALSTTLDGIGTANPAVTFYRFDVTAMFQRALADPAAFGLVNVTSSAAPGLEPGDSSYNTSQLVPNPQQYMFWDDLHPTAAVHAILAQRALDLFRLPGDFDRDNEVDAADYVAWRNGTSGSYIPDDFNVWRGHYGQVSGAGIGTAELVPEVGMLGLVAMGAVLEIAKRRRSRSKARVASGEAREKGVSGWKA
jgi:phospholipase/lecithinase/hemolysin